MDNEKQRRIQQIKISLMNSWDEYTRSLIPIPNNPAQENVGGTDDPEKIQYVERIYQDNLPMNLSRVDMDIDDVDKVPEQISSNTDTILDDEQNFDETNEHDGKFQF